MPYTCYKAVGVAGVLAESTEGHHVRGGGGGGGIAAGWDAGVDRRRECRGEVTHYLLMDGS